MFTSKLPAFIVPKTYKFQNIHRISACKFYHNSAKLCRKQQNTKNVTISPKCKERQEKLRICPKPSEAVLCCKRLFKKPEPKCKEQTIFEDYQKACEDITNRGNSLLKDVQEKSNSIINELNSYAQAAKENEETEIQKLSSSNKAKLSQLMGLDVSFGSLKRRCALAFNYQTRQDIQTLQCDLMVRIKNATKMAERVERDTLSCVDRAECLINSCRTCANVKELKKCIEENSDCAMKILEEGSKSAEICLKEIATYKQEIMKYYKITSDEAIKTYSKENAMFAKYLDDCIYAITKKRK